MFVDIEQDQVHLPRYTLLHTQSGVLTSDSDHVSVMDHLNIT